MNFSRTISFFALSVIFSFSISSAQSTQNRPFELSLGKEATIISAGAVVGAAAFLIMSNNSKLTEEGVNSLSRGDVNGFDRIAVGPYQEDVLGDALLYGSFLLPVTFLTYEDTREDFGTLSLMYGEVILVNAAINGLVKGLTTRNRPFVYDENSPTDKKYEVGARHAFYSGHTSTTASNSFFTARIFSEYLTNNTAKTLIWCGAALIPAVTGFSRVNTHNHFPTDVIVGYIVGAAIGYLIPELHEYENQSSEPVITDQIIHKPIFGFQISF
ncbi:MAG: phosphatase PAP2 family protein [Ignavibacteriaceae bacterium]|jgi:membrane-associated phospholipid phosphatase|nr:phosphatase PAP2 family protein [Ignavibacteriaceae bacterium]MCU0414452.1 phosphatase PAP2 family protein [Ignavibacteriaceae bacterium]